MLRLAAEHPYQVGIAHRRQWMVAHAGFGEQHIADEQVAAIDRSSVFGESRAEYGEIRVRRLHQRVGHGSNIALIRGVERGAVLEQRLPGSRLPEPRQS